MNPNPEGLSKLTNPQEELSHLRQEAVTHAESQKEQSVEITSKQAVEDTIKKYSDKPHSEVLHQEYSIKEHEAESIILDLSPEPHDRQLEEFISILQEKGIKNALTLVEKLNNPHLTDDFHRFLVQFIASGYGIPDLTERSELWKPLHMTLFQISLPEASEDDKQKQLKELISGMEQFYSSMLSISDDKKNPGWFTVEVANANGSDEFVFYVSVPTAKKELFEKQILAVYPGARVSEYKDDYNIFNDHGVSVASYARQSKHFLYPLKPYEEFDVDPLGAILNSFSKIDRDGEGAAIQFVIGQRKDHIMKESEKSLEKMRKGEKVSDALKSIDESIVGKMGKEIFGMFKSKDKVEKEKEEKAKRAEALDQTSLDQFTRKLSSPFVAINMRIVASAASQDEAMGILHDIESSFNQFEHGHGNRLEWKNVDKGKLDDLLEQFSLRTYDANEEIVLNLEEITTCLHFPATHVGKSAPQLKTAKSGTAPAPLQLAKHGVVLGINRDRGLATKILMSPEDRLRHFYVIGQTGTGKTTLLKNMIAQDIANGEGVCMIDPHGSDVEDILALIPKHRYEDVIYFDPSYTARPMALNMLEYDRKFPEQKTFVVNEMLSIFNKLFDMKTAGGPMFEQYFRNAVLLVMEHPESGNTLLDVSRVLSNKAYREVKLANCKNPIVVQFWRDVAEKAGGEASLANIVPYITSKFDVFLANDIMRPIIAQEQSSINFREIMDKKKILLVNLSKGRLGDINANLIGLILVGKILMAALSRVDSLGQDLPPFYLYIDEFQNVTTNSISTILSEARKYKLSLAVAHQFIAQLEEGIRDSVFGNVGSIASFRVGAEDAEFLEKHFAPVFKAKDIMSIDNHNAYLKMLANGSPLKPFNIETLAPPAGDRKIAESVKQLSYLSHGKDRSLVEQEILAKYNK